MDDDAATNQTVTDEGSKGIPLFMSYAHKDDNARQLIYDYLTSKGYDCHYDWEAEGGINAGNNWRSRIGQMIEEAHGNVVALLSGESMKANGVCRNELALALNVKNGRVQPILIAPESNVDIPPSIVHVQWLDMSDWSEREKDEAGFDAWFAKCMEELQSALEDPDFYSFNEEINELGNVLDVRQNFSKVYSLLSKDFYGREWLADEVDAWAKNPDSPQMLVLVGDPGFGKSAWAAHFAHYAGALDYKIAIGVFCERGTEELIDPKAVVQTIAFSLACRDENYRKELLEILRDPRSLLGNAKDLFKTMICDPLANAIDGGHENIVVLIDGLDEAGPANCGANPLAQLLGEGLGELPRWVKLLVTTRDVDPVTKELGKAFHDNLAVTKDLNASENRWEDIDGFVRQKLQHRFGSHPDFEDAVRIIKGKSNGDFLYASLVIDAIDNDASSLDLMSLERLSPGLSGAIRQWFQWLFGTDEDSLDMYDEVFADALGFILVAPDALPVDELPVLLSWREKKIKRFLRRISIVTKRGENEFGEETLSFNHDFVKTWLADEDASGDYYVSSREAKEIMARRLYERVEKQCESWKEPDDETKALSPYELINVLNLLNESDLKDGYEALRSNPKLIARVVALLYPTNSWMLPEGKSALSTRSRIKNAEHFVWHMTSRDSYSLPEKVAELKRVRNTPLFGDSRQGDEDNDTVADIKSNFFEEWSPAESVAMQKAYLLEALSRDYEKMLLLDEAERCIREIVKIKEWVLRDWPTKKAVDGYEDAIRNLSRLYEGGQSSISDDYEKAKEIHLEAIAVLQELCVPSEGLPYIADSIISKYKNLTQLASRHDRQDDQLAFAQKAVDVLEELVRDHVFEETDKVDCEGFWRVYSKLCDAYVETGDIKKGIFVLRHGIEFLEESLELKDSAAKNAKWIPSTIRFNALLGMHRELSRFAVISGDESLKEIAFEKYLDFIDRSLMKLELDSSEKVDAITGFINSYLGAIDFGNGKVSEGVLPDQVASKSKIIERVKPWFEALDSNIEDKAYLEGVDFYSLGSTPREGFVAALIQAGLHDEAIVELQQIVDRIQGMSLEGYEDVLRQGKLAVLLSRMADEAVAIGNDSQAIAYSREALENLGLWAISKYDSINDALLDSATFREVLLNAFESYTDIQSKINGEQAACKVIESKVDLLENGLEFALLALSSVPEEDDYDNQVRRNAIRDHARSIRKKLSLTYEDLSDDYSRIGEHEKAIAVCRRNIDLQNSESLYSQVRSLENALNISLKARNWESVYDFSFQLLEVAEQGASENLQRFSESIIGASERLAESLIRLKGLEPAKSFLDERKKLLPDTYSAMFQNHNVRDDVAFDMRRLQREIELGRCDDSEVAKELIGLISAWSGVEVSQSED